MPAALPSLNAAPALDFLVRFEVNALAPAGGKFAATNGTVQYVASGALLDIVSQDGVSLGRLLLQPEACRDDDNAACQRRFVASGRVQALGTVLNCLVPIRNDSSVGYAGQAFSGVCQDPYSRSYALHLYGR